MKLSLLVLYLATTFVYAIDCSTCEGYANIDCNAFITGCRDNVLRGHLDNAIRYWCREGEKECVERAEQCSNCPTFASRLLDASKACRSYMLVATKMRLASNNAAAGGGASSTISTTTIDNRMYSTSSTNVNIPAL